MVSSLIGTRQHGTPRALAMFALAGSLLYSPAPAAGQQRPIPPAVLAYPDLIVHNGRIVTMDDRSTGQSVGTIVQAMAVRDGEIMALGNTDAVLPLKGDKTRVIDLKGRTVIPGLIDTHSHFHDYAGRHWGLPGVPPPIVVRGEDPEMLMKGVRDGVTERVKKDPPGTWVRVSLVSRRGLSTVREGRLQKQFLDGIAPDHPVLLQVGTTSLVNAAAIKAVEEFFDGSFAEEDLDHETGISDFGTELGRSIPVDVLMVGRTRELVEITRKELEEQASHGITTYSSHIASPHHMNVFGELAREKDGLPIRFAWTHRSGIMFNPEGAVGFYRRLGNLSGIGTDFFWNIGSTVGNFDKSYPLSCTTIDARPEVKKREVCLGEEGHAKRQIMLAMVRGGHRITGTHVAGDRGIDLFLDVIEQGSKEAGLTDEQIRAKNHVIDHCAFSPRPEQYDRLKRLNITMSCGPKYLANAPDILADYGERYLNRVAPVRGLINAGVSTVWEIDDHDVAEHGAFHYLQLFVTRELEGRVWGPEQRVDRTTALKMATSWAADYVLRGDALGTLEEGKKADFIVLNRDYWQVPDRQIHTVRPLLTVVDGKVRYLDSGLAAELGAQPVGYQPTFATAGEQ
jgi:predicted amidohydrolase YtcJ